MTKSNQCLTVLIIRLCLVYDHHREARFIKMIAAKMEKLVQVICATFQAFTLRGNEWVTVRVMLKAGSASDKASCMRRCPGIMSL